MTSIQIVLSDKKTEFSTQFNPTIRLNKPCEIALINLETYYSIPNIKPGLNSFWLEHPTSSQRWNLKLQTGSYRLEDINKAIHRELNFLGLIDANDQYPVNISANFNTLKALMEVQEGYTVDFSENSLNRVLGFKPKKYKGEQKKIHESENVVNILNVNSILVNLNICSGSYVKGQMGSTVHTFFPNVNPSYKIIERPPFPVYTPIILKDIHSIKATLTDQDGELIDLRGENLTMRFHIRDIRTH